MRDQIRTEIFEIDPFDTKEEETQRDVLRWVDSGAELFRLKKPDIPPKHLVSYFILVDGEHLLLVDHRKAGLWLPSGGHVDPGEHPRTTVTREAAEELSIEAQFLSESPVFLTSTLTVGKTAGHTDVSLWYVLKGDRHAQLNYDRSEFRGVRWFHREDLPFSKADPELKRFINKFY